jgi:hypothetical protein
MRQFLVSTSILLCLIPLTGCFARRLGFQPKVAPEITAATTDPILSGNWLQTYQNQIKAGTCADQATKPINGNCPDGTAYTDFAKSLRNSYIEAIRAKIDDNYRTFKVSLYSGNAVFGMAADWAVIGLSGAGSVVADAGLKSILAVASGGVTGANSSYQKEVLNQQNTLAVAAAMEASRSNQYLAISQGEAMDVTKYSLEDALVNLRQYYDAGTMLGGLLYIQGQMQNQAQNNQKTSQGLKAGPLTITTKALSAGIVGTPYSVTLSASGGSAPYTWKIIGSLPAGLTLTERTGVISGTPTAATTSSLTVQAADSSSPAQTASADLSILVNSSH